MSPLRQPRRRGMTLIEVLLASLILGVGFTVLLSAASRCLASMKRAKDFQDAMWAVELGALEHPILFVKDIREQGVDGAAYGRMTFSRIVEEDDDKDGLYVVRSFVEWPPGGPRNREEVVELYYQPEEKQP